MGSDQNILRLLDVVKKTRIRKYYNLFRASLTWSREELDRYRLLRLKQLIETAVQHVPYYQSLFKKIDFKVDHIRNLADISNIPVLDRDAIRNHLGDLTTKKENMGSVFKGGSSGTTGIPIHYYQGVDGYSSGFAANYILWGLSGWRVRQRGVHIWGNSESIKNWQKLSSQLQRKLLNRMYIASTELNDPQSLPAVFEIINRFAPEYLDGYPNSIYLLAQYLKKNGKKIPSVKMIFTTAENLGDFQKGIIEEALAPIHDDYGCGEVNSIASRPINSERYYIFEPHVIVETENSGPNHLHDIIVTDLDNYFMPFIRYRIGDMIDEICDGEEALPVKFSYFKKIYGRSAEIISLPNGKHIIPVNVLGGTLFRKFSGIIRHKVTWNGRRLKLIFETDGSVNRENLHDRIRLELAEYDVPFEVELTERISPNKSGKFVFFELEKSS
jgi:phenylacetate-CoA ligase